VNDLLTLFIWAVIIGGIFAFLWRKGFLARITNYTQETRDELRKCAWPTLNELKGSIVVVMITVAILGVYVVGIDFIIAQILRVII
jgi:preprotein translocase subunit SecE